jgi:hypothetical protein
MGLGIIGWSKRLWGRNKRTMTSTHVIKGHKDSGGYRMLFAMVYCKIEPPSTKERNDLSLDQFLYMKM